ncbi:Putative disease resistance protein At4g11170 [Linum perenne]
MVFIFNSDEEDTVDVHPPRQFQTPSPPAPPPLPVKILENYDVFLNFRGVDLRNNFADHLYDKLTKNKDIIVFRDDKNLLKGDDLRTIFEIIDRSTMSVVLFSEEYATSKWCLDKLVKIVDCVERKGHVALPVFFDVSPEDVKGESGRFGMAIEKLGKMCGGASRVDRWRKALTFVAGTAGWHHAAYKY